MTDIEEIKQRLDIVSFIGDYVQLKKAGRNFKGICPFHSEKTPSFTVSSDRQIWHCFGACSEGGDAITFLMKIENIEFPEALEILAQKTGVKLHKDYRTTDSQKLRDELIKVHQMANQLYHYLLTKHEVGEEARLYLKARKISAKVIETFSLGYAPQSWDTLLKYFHKKNIPDNILSQSGLFIPARRGGFYDRFRGRIMFPLHDHRDTLIGFSGRLLSKAAKEAQRFNSPQTPLYTRGNVLYRLNLTKDIIKKAGSVILVEGEFDLLSSFQEGISNIVAIKGTALTESQVALLKRYTDIVLFSLDTDKAGMEALRRGVEVAEKVGINSNVVLVPQGKDPHDCIIENPTSWKTAISKKIPVYDFLLDSALQKYSLKDAYGKKSIVDELLPWYVRIENLVVQSHYLNLLSKTVSVSPDTLNAQAQKMKKLNQVQTPFTQVPDNNQIKASPEEYLLSLLLQYPEPKKLLLESILQEIQNVIPYLESPAIKKIIESFLNWIKNNKEKSPQVSTYITALQPELTPLADKTFIFDLGTTTQDEKSTVDEIAKSINNLKKHHLHMKLQEISTKIKSTNKEEELANLNNLFDQTKNELKKLDNNRKA